MTFINNQESQEFWRTYAKEKSSKKKFTLLREFFAKVDLEEIQELSARNAKILKLRFIDALTPQDLAVRTGLAQSSIPPRISQLLAIVRKATTNGYQKKNPRTLEELWSLYDKASRIEKIKLIPRILALTDLEKVAIKKLGLQIS